MRRPGHRALAGVAGLLLTACGGLPEPPPPSWSANGWTRTPLDEVLPREACPFGGEGSACTAGCRVEVRRTDGEEVTVTRHRVARGGRRRVRITRRADGSLSARAWVSRPAQRLDVLLELESAAGLDDDGVLSLLTAPARAAPGRSFHLARSWTRRVGPETTTLDEHGERAPTARFERHETDGGRSMWARTTAPAARARAVERGRTRRSVRVVQEDDRRARVTRRTERLDRAGYTVEERVRRGDRTERTVLRYDEAGRLARIETDGRTTIELLYRPDRTIAVTSSCLRGLRLRADGPGVEESCNGWMVRYDDAGRPTHGWHTREGWRSRVERDEAGRPVEHRQEPGVHVRIERDARGRWTREETRVEMPTYGWRRVVRRELDADGRLVRSVLATATRAHEGITPEPSVRSVVEVVWGPGCRDASVALPTPRWHDAVLDAPFEPRPFR